MQQNCMPRARSEQGGIDLRKLPKIIIRKLGKHKAWGLASHPQFQEVRPLTEPMLEVDTTTKGRQRLEIFIHEALHLAIPALPESVVLYTGKYLAKILWHAGYRADEEWQNGKFSNKNLEGDDER
jgi:hypothetical protein